MITREQIARRKTTEAAVAISDLRQALSEVRLRQSATGPTAAESCRQVLDMLDFGVQQIATYLMEGGVP